ncbi:uncharacterized protein [Ptychodera flava]|uniref:uncharacterized protein n=1 Tax=Ptychodera flava TaxID=63121 RepID=UPI00396A4BE7
MMLIVLLLVYKKGIPNRKVHGKTTALHDSESVDEMVISSRGTIQRELTASTDNSYEDRVQTGSETGVGAHTKNNNVQNNCRNSSLTVITNPEHTTLAQSIQEKDEMSSTSLTSKDSLINEQQHRIVQDGIKAINVNICGDKTTANGARAFLDTGTFEKKPDDNFDFKMAAEIDSNACNISHAKTGVSLLVQEDAVEVGTKQLIEIQVSRKYSPFNLQFDDPNSGFPLTPVVNCLAPGRKKFANPVILKIPHRGVLDRDSEWKVLYSHSPVGCKMSWKCLEKPKDKEHNNVVSDFYFTLDEGYVYIVTSHFTTYTCIQCNKKISLNLQLIIYGRYEQRPEDKQEVYFSTYFCDTIKDNKRAIDESEGRYASHSQFYSLRPKSSTKSWIVRIVERPGWNWELDKMFTYEQEIMMDTVYRHCKDDSHTPPFAKFKVVPKSQKMSEYIEAFFEIVQMKSSGKVYEKTKMTASLDFRFDKGNHVESNEKNVDEDTFDDPNVVDKDTIAEVAGKLDGEWKRVVRSLFKPDDGDLIINKVKDEQTKFYEKKYHSLLGWRQFKGSAATYMVLRKALNENGFSSIAEIIDKKVKQSEFETKV